VVLWGDEGDGGNAQVGLPTGRHHVEMRRRQALSFLGEST
jgi:hypothetical protein